MILGNGTWSLVWRGKKPILHSVDSSVDNYVIMMNYCSL